MAIVGIGTDLVAVARVAAALSRHGERFASRVLAAAEFDEWQRLVPSLQAAFLAKRFAAKEAFAKAWGTGFGAALSWQDLWVRHTALGQPQWAFAPAFATRFHERCSAAHLSIADEQDYALAFVVLEGKG